VLVCPLLEAIRPGNSNMQDVHRGNGGRHEDGGTGRVRFLYQQTAQAITTQGDRRRKPSQQTALQKSPYHTAARPRQTRTSLQGPTTDSSGQTNYTISVKYIEEKPDQPRKQYQAQHTLGNSLAGSGSQWSSTIGLKQLAGWTPLRHSAGDDNSHHNYPCWLCNWRCSNHPREKGKL
jgi:hypothetical protein